LTQSTAVLPREVTVDAKNVKLSKPLSLKVFITDKEGGDVPLLFHFHITDILPMMGIDKVRLFIHRDEIPSFSSLSHTLPLLIPFLQI
jgi:hypothetical protein